MDDDDAVGYFHQLCHRYEQEGWLNINQFLGWMARRCGIEDSVDEHSDDEVVEMMEDHEELARALQEHGSGYGDIHLVDLAGVLGAKDRKDRMLKGGALFSSASNPAAYLFHRTLHTTAMQLPR